MPWKESDLMDVRTEFILKSQTHQQSFVSLCHEYGISCKTGHKWKKRFHENGINGLYDQSRRPKSSPTMLSEDCICRLLKLKTAHMNWGPAKIKRLYENTAVGSTCPCLSSVKRILDKAGLVKHRKRRRVTNTTRITNVVTADKPNHLWTVDFKGSWYSPDRERIEPLTVRDMCSRYVLCSQILENGRTETVVECFKRLFRKYGLPQAIHSDNGSPFAAHNSLLGLSRLSVWWIALGITLNRSRPGKPQDNGAHERMHRDIADDVEYVSTGDLITQQAELEIWRKEFNELRPHESLGMATPSEFYEKSQCQYEDEDFELEYPAGYIRRFVSKDGLIKLGNRVVFITTALRGWHIGLQPSDKDCYVLWFGSLCLGILDMSIEKIKAFE